MTEDEARQKWCPFARQPDEYSETIQVNRNAKGEPVSLCIASDCMSWRWMWRKDLPKDKDGNPWIQGNVAGLRKSNDGYCAQLGHEEPYR